MQNAALNNNFKSYNYIDKPNLAATDYIFNNEKLDSVEINDEIAPSLEQVVEIELQKNIELYNSNN